jgi:hypothetical protein
MGAVVLIAAIIVLAAVRAAGRAGAAEADGEAAKRQVDAVIRDAETDKETLGRMADVQAASVSDTASAARQRMRDRNPNTR